MSIDSLAQRPRYQRSGKVRWRRLLPLLLIPLAVALAMGAIVCWAFLSGWYYLIVTPLLAALPVAAACFLTVSCSHCRSVLVAALLGVTSGGVMYLGYFHAHLITLDGPAAIHRVDVLPRFVQWRMQSDVEVKVGRPAKAPEATRNWLNFALELAAVTSMVGLLSAYRATHGYCETCGQWMRLGLQLAPPGTAQKVAEYLASGRLAELPTISQGGATIGKSSMIKVESCRRAGQAETCQAYLTLQEIRAASSAAPIRRRFSAADRSARRNWAGYRGAFQA